jgi:chaperonin GroEL
MVAPITSRIPEVLDDGGLIARRTIQLPNRSEDVGAMFLRGILWDIHEEVGDGASTGCVLFKALLDSASPFLASGINAAALRNSLLWGLEIILQELENITRPANTLACLEGVARTICREDRLAADISQILSISGVFGHIEVRKGHGKNVNFEFLEGAHWKSTAHSTTMLSNAIDRRIDIQRCRVFISDLDIQNQDGIVSLVNVAKREGAGGLLVIVKSITPQCIAVLLANASPEFGIVSVRTPDLTHVSSEDTLRDLEIITNGRAFHASAGSLAGRIKAEDLGSARHVWADRAYFGVVRGGSDPFRLRRHVMELQSQFSKSDDTSKREQLALRISRLAGSCAVLWADEAKLPAADKTTAGVRTALRGGVVTGGGAALLSCQSAIRPLLRAETSEVNRAALYMLHAALEAPIRRIIQNSGREPSPIVSNIAEMGAGHGWDAINGELVIMSERGILDPALVTKTALRKAIAGAAQALTIDTIVHRRAPAQSMQPQ